MTIQGCPYTLGTRLAQTETFDSPHLHLSPLLQPRPSHGGLQSERKSNTSFERSCNRAPSSTFCLQYRGAKASPCPPRTPRRFFDFAQRPEKRCPPRRQG